MTQDLTAASRRAAMTAAGLWRDETLLDHFRRRVAEHPDKTAVVSARTEQGDETRLSFRQLDALSDQLAIGLARHGIGEGDVVSFQLPNWWQFTLLHLAALKLGAISNPLLIIFRERELGFMLELAESKIFIVPARFRNVDHLAVALAVQARLPSLKHVAVVDGDGGESFDALIVGDATAAERAALAARRLSPDAVIELLYTSGTTGEPKGVCHTSNTMLSNLVPFAERLHLTGADVIHMPSPLAHQLGFMYGLVLPAMLGATAVLQDIFAPAVMAQQITAEQASVTMGATPFLNDLADYCLATGTSTPSLRIFTSAGAPIPRPLVSKAQSALGTAVISAWGMSENGAVTTTRVEDADDKVTGTDGCPLPGMQVRVVDAAGEPVATNVDGLLQVRGCSNFVGYLKRPDLARLDADGWFDTGDIARMDSDGYIRIAGRSKDIIIRGGENIPVVEVENLLFKHPAIALVAIVAYPDSRLGERACAFVVLRPGAKLSFDEMVFYLRQQHMAVQYIPERLEVRDALPSTATGKLQKFKLREIARQPQET